MKQTFIPLKGGTENGSEYCYTRVTYSVHCFFDAQMSPVVYVEKHTRI